MLTHPRLRQTDDGYVQTLLHPRQLQFLDHAERQPRDHVGHSTANRVELDLLRGGERLSTVDLLRDGDFYAFVSRPRLRPELDV
ncbi:MAG: hypothetical protein HUU20_16710 [Pirellulales bacterium]|nr:hypothetical protein [Pirellulales bacterium]